jgi:hypothetical protein
MRTARSILLLLPLLSLLACGDDGKDGAAGTNGTDGDEGAAGTDGTDGTDGIDGNDGADGTDGSAVLSGTLAPGEHLSLEHGLGEGDKFYEAQFSLNGVIYDHGDFATVRPGHTQDGAWFGSDDLESYYGEVAAAVLSSGDIVVVQNGYNDSYGDEIFTIETRSSDGSLVSAIDMLPAEWSTSDGYGEAYDPVVIALGDGGFAVFVEVYAYDYDSYEDIYGILMSRYDSAGTLQATEEYGEWGGDLDYYSVSAIATADGGFAAVMGGYDSDTHDDFTSIEMWTPGSGGSTFPVDHTDGSYGRIAELDDGRLAILVERELNEDAADGIDLLIAQPDGTLDAEIRLQNSYLTEDCALVLGSQGTLLVAAESGGPDLPFYAVVDTDGTVLRPATGMSGWENTMIEATAFADGDFLVMVTEDDSLAPMTWAISAQGNLLRPMVVGDITVVPDYDPGAFIPGVGNQVMHLAPSYDSDNAPYLSTYTKGILQLRVESDDEVRLYNETPDTLEVTLVAHRTP